MVYGIAFGKELLRFSGLPVVEPEIKVNPQFLLPNATLREFTEHRNHLATLAICVAFQAKGPLCGAIRDRNLASAAVRGRLKMRAGSGSRPIHQWCC